MLTAFALIILCLLIWFTYRQTSDYDSPLGLLLLLLTTSAIALRIRLLATIPSRLYQPETLSQSIVLTAIATVFSLVIILSGNQYRFKNRFSVLLVLYLFFGLLQQLLFQFVFLETISFLSSSMIITVITGTLFYSLFHMGNGLRYYLQTLAIYLVWSLIYIRYGNLLPLIISHGILGAAYYPLEAVSNRSRIYRQKLLRFSHILNQIPKGFK